MTTFGSVILFLYLMVGGVYLTLRACRRAAILHETLEENDR